MAIRTAVMILLAAAMLPAAGGQGHDLGGHHGPTYEVTPPVEIRPGEKRLRLEMLDAETGGPTAARFSLMVDGRAYVPDGLGPTGLRFVSIHTGKGQRFVALYSRASGPVDVPLPKDARRGVVQVAKGLEYVPEQCAFEAAGETTVVSVKLRQWSDVRARGWVSVEEHLHYDRVEPARDADWLAILAAEDLCQGHFMVLKGGNLPGIWADQYAYGPKGEASDGRRLIRPGEEYRDTLQGHINLLGVSEVIQPVQAGASDHPYHWPTFLDVLGRAKSLGGIVGPAHGTALGRSPTGIADTVLGAVDFFEIANTHLYETDVWYRLLNCGYLVPAVAGTDLPNYPFRDPWQPLVGETRTYAKTGGKVDFESFRAAVARGETFVSSGPMLELTVNGVGPGGSVRLPAGGGEVSLEVELSSARPLETLEVVQGGKAVAGEIVKRRDGPVRRWQIRRTLPITHSTWLAARGTGELKQALLAATDIRQHTIAHTSPVRVLVGDEPIASAEDAAILIERLASQKEFYRRAAKYERQEQRDRVTEIFDAAIRRLESYQPKTAE